MTIDDCKFFVVQNVCLCPSKIKINPKKEICMGANEGSSLGGKNEKKFILNLFRDIIIWFSAAQKWKEFFKSDVKKWSYNQVKIPVWLLWFC